MEAFPEQTISVILVSDAPDAEALAQARSLQASCTHPPMEIVVPLTSDVLSEDRGIQAVRVSEGASLAHKISRAVEHSTGEILVFVDQALSPAGEDWLSELVGPLQNREIGIVGGMMLKPDTAEVRHAGLVCRKAISWNTFLPVNQKTLDAEFGGPTWYRDWSAVSGACFSLRREVWNSAGGFSGALQYPRLDVDLCSEGPFQAGLRVVYNPFASFYQSKPAALEGWLWRVGPGGNRRIPPPMLPLRRSVLSRQADLPRGQGPVAGPRRLRRERERVAGTRRPILNLSGGSNLSDSLKRCARMPALIA